MQPVHFVFGVHLHQPVGNFDHVFEEHVHNVYRPLLTALAEREFFPVALHISGPLLDWLEAHDAAYLDLVGRLAADGHVELLLSGFYEPILASIPTWDRVEQITWMRDALERRFGVTATGLWLTERVWEPALAADLADARVGCVLVDDRHFLVTGFERDQLHWPYRTENDLKSVGVLPIDERLRYLIPFRPPSETADFLRSRRERGFPLAVFADDGEKFGGWPGTKEWVYDRGWLRDFLDTIGGLIEGDEVKLVTPAQALSEVESAGLVYLPTTSYREMEQWSLHPMAASRLQHLATELGEERMNGPDGGLIRGGHWRNFLARYPESNRMHKKMCHLSRICRDRGNPADARREIGKAQCNDAYWHGVFGGLYLPHLRNVIWQHLAGAESILRRDEELQCEVLDLDGDGHDELWIHSSRFSALISPHRGGGIEEYTVFGKGVNYANVLTRTIEAYHRTNLADHAEQHHDDGGAPSIHDLEHSLTVTKQPPQDIDPRAILLDRVLPHDIVEEAYMAANYEPLANWARAEFRFDVGVEPGRVTIRLEPVNDDRMTLKQLTFSEDGGLSVRYEWRADAFPTGSWFTTELSVAAPLTVSRDPDHELWSHAIATVAKSERGLEETVQGQSLTPRWRIEAGACTLQLEPVGP
jgi:hypothetical protein